MSLLFLTVFLLVFSLYLLTLAPGVVGGDAGEHQFAVPLLGIPHTTGYPLYLLLGKLWTLLIPIGSPAWRMNLFSALNGALAAATTALIVYHLSLHLTPRASILHPPSSILHPPSSTLPGALVAGLTLACGLTLWQWSTIAGVRSMNVFFFALLTLEAILWQHHRQPSAPPPQQPIPDTATDLTFKTQNSKLKTQNSEPKTLNSEPKTLNSEPKTLNSELTLHWLAFTVGLSLAHHRTTLFYLPSLAGWILWHDPALLRQPKRLLTLIGLALAPLLLYLFIYIRGVNNPPYTHEPISDLASFWFLVGSGDSAGLFGSIDPAFLPARLAFIWADLLTQLSLPGVSLAALGGLLLLWRQTGHFLMQSLLVILLLLFTLDFEVVNLGEAPTWYLMPAYFILAVWLGVGVNGILDFGFWIYDLRFKRLDKNEPSVGESAPFIIHHSSFIQFFMTVIITALLAYTLAWPNWRTLYAASVEPLDEWRQLLRGTQAQRFVESSLPYVEPNSIIWGDWEQYTPFRYYQLIHGQRTDVTVRLPLDRWPEKVAAAHAANQPVYFSRKTTDLIGTRYLSMAGPLIHLQTRPQRAAPSDINPRQANFEDELELLGYRAEVIPQLTPGGAQAGPILQLMFYWRVPHPVTWDYALSLRLLDSAGQELYKRDTTHPVLSSYPTHLWTPGEVVGDFYELPFPPHAGPLTLHLLPYRTEGPGRWHNLTLNGVEPPQEGVRLGPFGE